MKKSLSILFLTLGFSAGCGVQIPYIPSVALTESVNYSRFAGFFLTESNSVSFPYEPIGSVQTVQVQGIDAKTLSVKAINEFNETRKRFRRTDSIYTTLEPSTADGNASKISTKVTLEGTLEKLVNEAKALGANGIINLKIKPVNEYQAGSVYGRHGYEVTGMAILKK